MNIKINNTLYPAEISGRMKDQDWDGRESKAITLEMTHADAISTFVNGLAWAIQTDPYNVLILDEQGEPILDEQGNPTFETKTDEYDNADYCVAGDITDHRDGTITVKMGKPTELEDAYELLYGGED